MHVWLGCSKYYSSEVIKIKSKTSCIKYITHILKVFLQKISSIDVWLCCSKLYTSEVIKINKAKSLTHNNIFNTLVFIHISDISCIFHTFMLSFKQVNVRMEGFNKNLITITFSAWFFYKNLLSFSADVLSGSTAMANYPLKSLKTFINLR